MINGKFFSILIGIIIAIIAIWNSNIDSNVNVLENFINYPMKPVRMPVGILPNGKEVALSTDYAAIMATNGKQTATLGPNVLVDNSKVYMTPPNFQSVLSPRFSNQGYGAYINYNLPDEKNLGVPNNPLGLSNMVSEGYCSNGSCGSVQGCNKGGLESSQRLNAKASMDSSNNLQFNPSYENAQASLDYSNEMVDSLPVGDMTVLGADGNDTNVVTFDRMIYSTANGKYRKFKGQTDFIRGDLAIAPCNMGWFNTYPTPQLDLNTGAMAVLGGIDNDTSKSVYAMTLLSSGGLNNTVGGVNLSETVDITPQKMGFAGNNTSEISYTAFP